MRSLGENCATMPFWTVNGVRHVGVNTLTWSRMHHAAGGCLLCAALMLGTGSAIAAADPSSHSGGSATHTDNRGSANTPAKVKPLPAAQVGDHLADVLRNTINDVTSVLSTGRTAAPQTPGSAAPT